MLYFRLFSFLNLSSSGASVLLISSVPSLRKVDPGDFHATAVARMCLSHFAFGAAYNTELSGALLGGPER